jgi:PKD repeat protein
MPVFFRRAANRIVVSALLAACGGSDLVLPGAGEPASIRVVEGDGQSGEVGGLLGDPVVVEVTDAGDHLVEGAAVVFELTSAAPGADILPRTATTDATGRASALILLGNETGVQAGEARVVVEAATPPTTSFTAIALPEGAVNQPPTAGFDWTCDNLDCRFHDASSDGDGSVTAWDWRFGDGAASTDREPSHVYSGPGTYSVTLTVTDNEGATAASQAQVTVTAPPPQPNDPPNADFDVHCEELTCTFTDKSKDDDGTVVAWRWDFADGSTASTEQNPVHIYASGGDYEVTLTVTDDRGASDTKTHKADAVED